MYMLCRDEKLSVQVSSLFVRKRNEKEDSEDEPARKRGKLRSATERQNQASHIGTRAGEGAGEGEGEVCAADGVCQGRLPGKVSERGKSRSTPAVGLLTESPSKPETETCSMDVEEDEGRVREDCRKDDEPKLYLTESASARLTQVFKLENDLRERTKKKEATEMCQLTETNCVADELSINMETESAEPEKMPELYYYM